jgi:hypothetical protein
LDALFLSPGRVQQKNRLIVIPTGRGGAELRLAVVWQ